MNLKEYEYFNSANITFRDLMSDVTYIREKQDLVTRGLFLDMEGMSFHVFELLGH